MEHFWEITLHALKDTYPLLLWVFLIYALIELLDGKTNLQKGNKLSGRLGPVIGSATGLIPQCGFSVMASKLYEKKYITVGTLLAIFFATSDEAFIILLSSGAGAIWVLPLLASKIALGIVIGYGVDGFFKLIGRAQVCEKAVEPQNNKPKTSKDIFLGRYEKEQEVEVVCSCGKIHDGNSPWVKYLLNPFLHTLKVGAFIFLVNFVLTAIIHGVGESAFTAFMQKGKFVQPFISCAIGLIPNCASSVVITEAFLSGGITFGSCVAGLCANAGMGFVVLLKNTKQWKRNLALIGFCYIVSAVVGVVMNIFV